MNNLTTMSAANPSPFASFNHHQRPLPLDIDTSGVHSMTQTLVNISSRNIDDSRSSSTMAGLQNHSRIDQQRSLPSSKMIEDISVIKDQQTSTNDFT
jgi:hypothetical protein